MDQETNNQYNTRSKKKGSVKKHTLPLKRHKVKIIDHHDEDNINFKQLYSKNKSKKNSKLGIKKKASKKKVNKKHIESVSSQNKTPRRNIRMKVIEKKKESMLTKSYGNKSSHSVKKNSKSKKKNKSKKTPPLKVVELNKSQSPYKKNKVTHNKVKININEDATSLLTSLILNRAFDAFKKKNKTDMYDSDYNSDSDSDFELIEGIPDDIEYMEEENKYIKNLNKSERDRIFMMEKEIINFNKSTIPIRFRILQSNLNVSSKNIILKKLDHFYTLEETENEYSKLYQWVEGLEKIPLGQISKMNMSLNNHSNEIINYFQNVKKTLDESVYGHEIAKNKIIQILAQNITNPECSGNCIAIQGPPGNGKTTLVKDGICKAIGRPFGFIALGGMQNSDFMIGHDYTYEGGKPGRIVEILQECQCMNPVIYFDELDKISDTPKGEEIAGVLCHLTDPSQNDEFHDKYFSGIDFDISKAIFIFSYNDESKVNKILLDRMTKIHTTGFGIKDKVQISKNYLIPRMCKNIGFNEADIIFPDEVIQSIISNRTNDEKGVRNLKRCFETIISKLNVIKLLNGFSNFDSKMDDEKDREILNQNSDLFEEVNDSKKKSCESDNKDKKEKVEKGSVDKKEKKSSKSNNKVKNKKEKVVKGSVDKKKRDKKNNKDEQKKKKHDKKSNKKRKRDDSGETCYFCKKDHSSNDCPTIENTKTEEVVRDFLDNLVDVVITKVDREKNRKPISNKDKKNLVKYHINKCKFPITVTSNLVNKLLDNKPDRDISKLAMYL